MVEDTSQEYAVPRYRDPERAARIVEARRRGETYKEISAREGVSPQRIQQIYRKAVLTVRHPPKPCARPGCGKPVPRRTSIHCSQKCAVAARDEEGMAEVQEMVEHERRVLALLDQLPKDRTISRDEAERFLVELYRTGMKYSHIAKRTNCYTSYVEDVVRRRAPELARPREGRGKKKPPLGPLLDFRELRNAWRFARHGAPKNSCAISRCEAI